MTATSVPPTAPQAPVLKGADDGDPTSGSRPTRSPHTRTPAYLGWAEAALALVTVAAVFGFSRLFDGWGYFWPLVAVAVYTHLATILVRRLGRGLLVAAGVGLTGFVLISSWIWFFDTTVVGVPTFDTLSQARLEMDASWTAFHELQAPVPTQTGLLLASAIALFFAVFLADWAAFRLWSPIESLVPTATLFVFAAVLGAGQHRISSAVAYCGAVAAFLLLHRLVRIDLSGSWISGQAGAGGRWLLVTGAAIATIAVLGGAVIGGGLPGLDHPVIDWRGDTGPHGPRVTVSPLVDIRSRLVEQSATEVFTVESPVPAYWRMTALDTFDGTIWRSGGKYEKASGKLPADIPPAAEGATIQQTFTITGLSAIWLPAAFQPVAIDPNGADVRYQSSSSTLIVDTDLTNSNALTYVVQSEVPQFDPATLSAPTTLDLNDDLKALTELPEGFSADATALAAEVVAKAGADSPYEQARALQDFFRNEGVFAHDEYEWTYDLSAVGAGHDTAAIDEFIARRSGYCEQYAGTYAAMARSLGLPARVAVGFTWGETTPDAPNRYRVSGRNAHAWPEVWLGDEVGWVSFEPTPGRGEPGHEDVTGIQQQQADPGGGGGPTPTTQDGTSPTSEGDPEATTTTEATSPSTTSTHPPASLSTDSADRSAPVLRAIVLLLLVAGILLVVATPLAKRANHRRRRHAATTPGARIHLAWLEAMDDLAMAGVPRAPSETHREYGERAQRAFPAPQAAIALLTSTSEIGAFAGDGVDGSLAEQAEAAAAEIHEVVRDEVPTWRRIFHALDPRTLGRS